MSAAYGAIAHKICQCMHERRQLLGSYGDGGGAHALKKEDECVKLKGLRRIKTEQSLHSARVKMMSGYEETQFTRSEGCFQRIVHQEISSQTIREFSTETEFFKGKEKRESFKARDSRFSPRKSPMTFEQLDRIDVCPANETTVSISATSNLNVWRPCHVVKNGGRKSKNLQVRNDCQTKNGIRVRSVRKIQSDNRLLREREILIKNSLTKLKRRIQTSASIEKQDDVESNHQHFCVFENEFLKYDEPAWIPINYGTRVQKESLKKFRKAIRMLCVIIVVFVLCWTPFLTFNILQSFGFVQNQLHGFAKHLKTALTLMAYLNSALNPIIYGFMCKSFRENFRKTVFSSRCWRNKPGSICRVDLPKSGGPHHKGYQKCKATKSNGYICRRGKCGERGSQHLEVGDQQQQQQIRQWVSSCGCVHSTSGNGNGTEVDLKIDIIGEELCGGCGCICGEGHRHYNQKLGTECQLICCNAHGLRVNRSRSRNQRNIFVGRRNPCGNKALLKIRSYR